MPSNGSPPPAPPAIRSDQSGELANITVGTASITEKSMSATVNSVLGTADQIGNFWTRWGVSASLFTIGTFSIIVAFLAHAADAKLWDDSSFFGALAFALAILVLGFVAFADKQNRSGQSGQQAVKIYEITVNASLEGQRIGAEERERVKPSPDTTSQTGGTNLGG